MTSFLWLCCLFSVIFVEDLWIFERKRSEKLRCLGNCTQGSAPNGEYFSKRVSLTLTAQLRSPRHIQKSILADFLAIIRIIVETFWGLKKTRFLY